MAIHSARTSASRVSGLTRTLVNSLKSARPGLQPIVYEDHFRETGTYHVLVIWDKFKGVSSVNRTNLILDAYERTNPARVPKISVALGMTPSEAIDIGMLPFAVISVAKKGEVDEAKMKKLLLESGAVKTADGLQLRFRSLDDAQQSYRRIQKVLPGPFWALSQEQRIGA
jgi:hypothetical protein